jgi:hypothetical protein
LGMAMPPCPFAPFRFSAEIERVRASLSRADCRAHRPEPAMISKPWILAKGSCSLPAKRPGMQILPEMPFADSCPPLSGLALCAQPKSLWPSSTLNQITKLRLSGIGRADSKRHKPGAGTASSRLLGREPQNTGTRPSLPLS